MMPELPYSCQRARALAAHDLDGEISELESHLLRQHLAGCHACTAFSAEISEIAGVIRAAPLERLAIEFRPRRRRARRHARRSVRRLVLTAATVVVAAPVLAMATGLSRSDDFRPPSPPATVVDTVQVETGDVRRGVPIMTYRVLPLGQLNAAGDF